MKLYNRDIDLQICLTVFNKTTDQLKRAVESIPKFAKIRIDIDGGWTCKIDWTEISKVREDYVLIYHNENRKLGKLRNIQLKECTHEWIQFMDADDTLNKDAWLQLEVNSPLTSFLVSPVNFISKGVSYVDNRNLDVKKMNGQSFYVIPSIVFKTNFLKEHDLKFDESGYAYEDVIFSVKLTEYTNLAGYLGTYYNYELPEPNSGTLSCPIDNNRVIDSTLYVIEQLGSLELSNPIIGYVRVVEECLRLLQIPDLDRETYLKIINYMKPYKHKPLKLSCRK